MERVGHGLYISQDAWEDFVYQIALTHKGIIFSHETALYLHVLRKRVPHGIGGKDLYGGFALSNLSTFVLI